MARNIEIKARVEDFLQIESRAARLADQGPTLIAQDDTFFECASGRLKLRAFDDGSGELIFYRRADRHGTKESFYVRSPTSSADTLREALSFAYGVVGRVRKMRTLYMLVECAYVDLLSAAADSLECRDEVGDRVDDEIGASGQ